VTNSLFVEISKSRDTLLESKNAHVFALTFIFFINFFQGSHSQYASLQRSMLFGYIYQKWETFSTLVSYYGNAGITKTCHSCSSIPEEIGSQSTSTLQQVVITTDWRQKVKNFPLQAARLLLIKLV